MTLSLNDGGAASGLLIGLLLGFVLEGAGMGSPRKLTAQFTLRDFTLFRVIATAIIVAATGLWLLEELGLAPMNASAAPTLSLWTIAGGGMLIGAGFVIGGYCPMTSIVGLASGRLDALVFIAGMVIGADLFAFLFGWFETFGPATKTAMGPTMSGITGLAPWGVLLIVAVLSVVASAWGALMEDDRGGPMAANWVLP